MPIFTRSATTAALCAGWALTAAAFDSAVPGAAELPATLARQAELMAGQAPALLYLSLVTTALANWLQALGQKSVSAQDAAIVYALDPVYGALFAAALLGERLGPQGLAGAHSADPGQLRGDARRLLPLGQ